MIWFKKKDSNSEMPDPEKHLLEGIYAFETGKYEHAAAKFEAITDAFPEHALAYLMLGRTHIELKQYEKAGEALRMHLEVVPYSVEGMICLGLSYYENNDYALAEEWFRRAMTLRADSLLVRENLAITLIAASELEQALEELTNLYEEQPHDPAILGLLVLTLGKLGRWEAASQLVAHSEEPDMPFTGEDPFS